MQLLSVALPHHDVNLAWFDGATVRYIKCERTRQQKRFHFARLADWRAEAEALWGVDVAAVDDVVFSFDPASLPPSLQAQLPREALLRLALGGSEAERLPPGICEHLGVRRGWLASHHGLHALSTWMLEPRDADVQVVIDGVGDGRPWSVYRRGELVAVGDLRNGSIGWGMREAGKLLGIQAAHYNDIAGKLMGLQAYGRIDAGYLRVLDAFGFERLVDLWSVRHWEAYRGEQPVPRESLLDWAATVHHRMGEMLVRFFERFAGPADTVSYSGGVAQNVVWNALLRRRFPRLVIPPHASDEGLALGGIEWLRRHHGLPPLSLPGFPFAQSDEGVPPPSPRTIHVAAQVLAQGGLVGWYQGQGEIGPRALGHRSILMDPRLPRGRDLLNRVKRREGYRPFGGSVLQEHFDAHFEGAADAFMLHACRVRTAEFPALTHVDGSSRMQLVAQEPAALRALIAQFQRLGGCPVLVNTSLNLAGKPIAASPDHARALFAQAPLHAMVIGDELLLRGSGRVAAPG